MEKLDNNTRNRYKSVIKLGETQNKLINEKPMVTDTLDKQIYYIQHHQSIFATQFVGVEQMKKSKLNMCKNRAKSQANARPKKSMTLYNGFQIPKK